MRHSTAIWSAAIVTGLVMVATPAAAQPDVPPQSPPVGDLASVLQPVATPLSEAVDPVAAAIQDATGIDVSAQPAPDDSAAPSPSRQESGSGVQDSGTASQTSSSTQVSVDADEESGLAVDAKVADLASVCVRIDPDGADGPIAATIRLLDQDVLAALQDAGVPVDELVVPCPAGVGNPADRADDDTSGDAVAGTSGDRPGPGASRVPAADRLAYTGSPMAGLTAAGVGLLLSGAGLLRRFRRSAAPAGSAA